MLKLFLALLFSYAILEANIQLIKKENDDSNTTLLVIAGIHGDEPGGYFAASILATNYTIKSKNLWIVPNLNKASIQRNRRGINGDMNRKFAKIKSKDKDTKTIQEVKEIILSKRVSLVLNLHDGHGFYRKENHSKIFNPNAWGQTCVIDQCKLDPNQPFGNLSDIAIEVKNNLNKHVLEEHHSFNVKNTKTKFDDEAMQLSLTYFAVTNNKPAFAIESSKNLSSLYQKVFYQLLAIEEFMKIMGIEYKKDFILNEQNIKKIIHNYGNLLINSVISLNLNNIKKSLSYFPLQSSSNEFKFTHPLGSVKRVRDKFIIYIGNKKVTTFYPQYFDYEDNCSQSYIYVIDGKKRVFDKTSEIYVTDDFKVVSEKSTRVNIIGFRSKKSESDIVVSYDSMNKRFSIDKNKKTFRVEFYKNKKFCSMQLVHFK